MRAALWGLLVGLLLAGAARAHPLAPALLELSQTGVSDYALLWRSPLARAAGREPQPLLPSGCRRLGELRIEDDAVARSQRWSLQCAAPLAGQTLRIEGLAGSGINVIVRYQPLQGQGLQKLLSEREPAWTLPAASAPPSVFASYLRLGVEHLLGGYDHLCFVIALVLLLRRPRALLLAVTAFTVGHSLTLSLAVLGLVRVNPGFTEFAIALSILVLALELLRPAGAGPGPVQRWPWALAGGFGLLHGLGFAGALADIGLPEGEIPLALLAFNLGIELGQLLVVAGLLGLGLAWRRMPTILKPELERALPAYLIGSLAAYWCLERAGGWFRP